MSGPSGGLLQRVIGLYVVSNPLVSGCGVNRATRPFVRQDCVLKSLGFDDGDGVTPSEATCSKGTRFGAQGETC